MATGALGITLDEDRTVWYKEKLTDDLTKMSVLGPGSVRLGNAVLKKIFDQLGKGRWRGFFEHSTETQCKSAGAFPNHTCYICGYPIRNKNGSAALGGQCEHIIACVQLIFLCGLAGEEWEISIDNILDALSLSLVIPEGIKQAYKEWRAGIVGKHGVDSGIDQAREGGGKEGIAYLYAHPACNSLKDNDQFIRIIFNPDGSIKILCTAPHYYGGDGWNAHVKEVVPHDYPAWDPRFNIPSEMNEPDFTVLTSDDAGDDAADGDVERIYSSICWKNIYWLLCSLVGYNFILKTQVQGVASKKAISDGATKTVDWRKVVFAPWTEPHHAQWGLHDALANHSSIFGSNQYLLPTGVHIGDYEHPSGGGLVYNKMPLMIDRAYRGFVKTEDWIKHRADRIGEHLKPLIKNIQTETFEVNSQSF
jgi:hypothetical protein